MKAIVYTRYGPPGVLQLKEIEKPVPKPHEILVRVMAATVNRTDCANLSAKPFIMRFSLGLFKPKKQVLGTEFAGVVEAVGTAVSTFRAGDKVFGFDDGIVGSYAGYLVIAENKAMATLPRGISWEQAAASLEGAHYAYNFINKVDLSGPRKVLVNGASGGIGTATVQLLKHFGAEITAVCNTKNIELVRSLGANRVIDYLSEDFTKDGERYDYVFDSVGKSTFGKCRSLLKPGGIYISSELGPMVQNLFYALVTAILGRMPLQDGKKVIFPYPPNIMRTVILIKKLLEEGKFKPVIDRTYPLEQIGDAFAYVAKGLKTGNVVITMEERK